MINKVKELFIEAVKVPSPSGKEKQMCLWVRNKMDQLGWKTWIDDAGQYNDSNTGNLYAYLEKDKTLNTMVFVAHLDTVQSIGEFVNPVIDKIVLKSDGTTVLGADNKAGVVALLSAAQRINKNTLNKNVLFFFPTREESGVMGSSFFQFTDSKVDYVFNVDNSDKPGVFINKALGYLNFKIIIKGRSVHAAKDYNEGVDAVKAAGNFISQTKIGVDKKVGWTMNLGVINGGKATNVVCDEVLIRGELRAFEKRIINKKIKEMMDTSLSVGKSLGTKVEVKVEESSYIPPLNKKNSKIENLCEKVCKQMKIKAAFKTSYSTSDANSFGEKYEVLSISRGGKDPHSKKESVDISDVKLCSDMVYHLINL